MQQLTIFDFIPTTESVCLNCSRFNIVESFGNMPTCFRSMKARPRLEPTMAACEDFKKADDPFVDVMKSSYEGWVYPVERKIISLPEETKE